MQIPTDILRQGQMAHNIKTMLAKRLVKVDEEYVIPFFSDILKHTPSHEEEIKPFFVVGDVYKLSGADCDDFIMPEKEYELVAVLENVNDIILDSVVMRQISGDISTIFSLTKLDCKNLNIDFQRGLQIFPKNLNWEHKTSEHTTTQHEGEYVFDSSLLRTYPCNYADKTIHKMTIKISGFSCNTTSVGNMILKTPNQIMSTEGSLLKRLVIKTKRNIGVASDTNTASFPKDREIFYKCITNQVSRLHRGSDIIDEDGCIYLELCLERRKHGTDTAIGVNPEILGDASFADLFDIFIEDYYSIDDKTNNMLRNYGMRFDL